MLRSLGANYEGSIRCDEWSHVGLVVTARE